jgi:uncharacterized short protein YbdD (DUF466 family)
MAVPRTDEILGTAGPLVSEGARPVSFLARLEKVASVVRRIIGVPDYDVYLKQHARCYPGVAPLSREDFHTQRLYDKYNRPGQRCC